METTRAATTRRPGIAAKGNPGNASDIIDVSAHLRISPAGELFFFSTNASTSCDPDEAEPVPYTTDTFCIAQCVHDLLPNGDEVFTGGDLFAHSRVSSRWIGGGCCARGHCIG